MKGIWTTALMIGGALAADRPFQLHLAFRNHGSRKLRILSTNILAASGLAIDEKPSATVKRGEQVEVVTTIKPLAAGSIVKLILAASPARVPSAISCSSITPSTGRFIRPLWRN